MGNVSILSYIVILTAHNKLYCGSYTIIAISSFKLLVVLYMKLDIHYHLLLRYAHNSFKCLPS